MRAPLNGTLRKDGRWQITLTLTAVTGAKHKKTFYGATQSEVRAKALKELQTNEERRPRPTMTLSAFLDVAETERFGRLEPHTQKVYGFLRSHYVEPMLGKHKLQDLKPHHVEQMMKSMADRGLSRQTCLHARGYLRAALEWAVKNEWVERNAAKAAEPRVVWSGVEVRQEREPMSLEQYAAALQAEQRPVLKALWRTLAETGLRPHREAGRLTWSDLRKEEDGYWLFLTRSKTKAGLRPVPVSESLAQELLDLPRNGPFIFSQENGAPFQERNLLRFWQDLLASINVPTYTLYELRHLFGRMKARQVPDHLLQRFMRHTDVRTTKQYYLNAERKELREATDS